MELLVESSLKYHSTTARKNGVTKTEMAEILTHVAFLCRMVECMGSVQYDKRSLCG